MQVNGWNWKQLLSKVTQPRKTKVACSLSYVGISTESLDRGQETSKRYRGRGGRFQGRGALTE